MQVSPIPEGFQSLCPYMTVPNARAVLAFLQTALDAEVIDLSAMPGGPILNSELRIRGSRMMLSDARDHTPRPGTIYMYVEDCDATYRRAIAAGAVSLSEPADMFYGDRHGGVTDVGGNQWWFATRKENLTGEEVMRRAAGAHGK